jgi:hypothetical protein
MVFTSIHLYISPAREKSEAICRQAERRRHNRQQWK